MRASLIVKATVSSAPATLGTIARNTTANSNSPRRLHARISAMVLDPSQQIFAHRGCTRRGFAVSQVQAAVTTIITIRPTKQGRNDEPTSPWVRGPSAPGGGRAPPQTKMAMQMTSRTIGSGQREPEPNPETPNTTANEVNPSVRAWTPSATSAADPIRHPDPVDRHHLVAEEPDQSGYEHPQQLTRSLMFGPGTGARVPTAPACVACAVTPNWYKD